MPGAWPYMPGVPAAGHVTGRGYWHPGPVPGCAKCVPFCGRCGSQHLEPRCPSKTCDHPLGLFYRHQCHHPDCQPAKER